MDFYSTVEYAKKKYFPNLNIKFKNNSFLMKILSYLLFFNKKFMTQYATSSNNSIVYFPSEDFIRLRSISSIVILLHELIHVNDSIKLNYYFYSFLYMLPQSLILFTIPLMFFSLKIGIILTIICLLPLPAYFRMRFERKAYFASLYVLQALANKLNYNSNLDKRKDNFLASFKDSSYYWMWILPNLNKQFDDATTKIKNGEKPYDDPIFDILDDLVKN